MRKIGQGILAGALAAWLLAIASCASAPTAPRLDSHGALLPGGASPGAQLNIRPPVIEPPKGIDDGSLELVSPVTGSSGCTIKVADVTVHVPADAIEGDAQIKVTIPDSTRLECHLEIFPPSMNHFAVPVRLEFDASHVADIRVMTVLWFDESQHEWVQLPSYYDATTRKVWADLPHFSIYKAESEIQGRAGW